MIRTLMNADVEEERRVVLEYKKGLPVVLCLVAPAAIGAVLPFVFLMWWSIAVTTSLIAGDIGGVSWEVPTMLITLALSYLTLSAVIWLMFKYQVQFAKA